MAIYNMSYCKSLLAIILLLCLNVNWISGQGNCLIYPEDSGERLACELSYRASEYRQGSRESQLLFDAAIRLGPNYAWAYYQKSVPFFKRGLFADGVSLINRAIELEPQNYLHYRAYWYFYNRSYEYCIRDLEELYTVHRVSYVATPGGELEMRQLLAMAYALSGNVEKGIYWMQNLMERFDEQPLLMGFYDHFCLGLMYFANDQLALAELEFEKQLAAHDNFADTYYYLGLIKEKEADYMIAQTYFQQALTKFRGEEGGYSSNLFTEFNTSIEDVEAKLED